DRNYATSGWSNFDPAQPPNTGTKEIAAASTGNTVHLFSIGDDDIIYGADGDYNTGNWTRFWALPDNADTKRIATASN
ncbi:hypothetical protein ACFVYI_42015, partial [Kitasatospora sp. NPDC058218]